VYLRLGLRPDEELLEFWRNTSGRLLPDTALEIFSAAIVELNLKLVAYSSDEVDERIFRALEGYVFEETLSMARGSDPSAGAPLSSYKTLPSVEELASQPRPAASLAENAAASRADSSVGAARGAQQQEAKGKAGHVGSPREWAKAAQADTPRGRVKEVGGFNGTLIADGPRGTRASTVGPKAEEVSRFDSTSYRDLEEHRRFCEEWARRGAHPSYIYTYIYIYIYMYIYIYIYNTLRTQ